MTDNAVRVTVDIVDNGRALIAGPGIAGYVVQLQGPRTATTNRPTYMITLSDDTPSLPEGERSSLAPLESVTRTLRVGFPAGAVKMARRLAAHYGYTDVRITLDDETGNYQLPSEV